MASVGGVSCTFIRGEVPPLKQRTETWQTPGIDGYGAQKMGRGDAEFELVLIYYGSSRTAVNTWLAAIAALQGTVVTIVNDWGTSYTYCLIQRVETPTVAAAAGSSITDRAEVKIKAVRTQ